jgi:hypothetical protein
VAERQEYADYLNSPEWKELRKRAYARSQHKCELCGGAASAVHHIQYPKHYTEDNLFNLMVVCESCHSKLHGLFGVWSVLTDKDLENLVSHGATLVLCADARGSTLKPLGVECKGGCCRTGSCGSYCRGYDGEGNLSYNNQNFTYVVCQFPHYIESFPDDIKFRKS